MNVQNPEVENIGFRTFRTTTAESARRRLRRIGTARDRVRATVEVHRSRHKERLPVEGSFNGDSASGAGVGASAATSAVVADDGDVFNFDRATGASFGTSATTDTQIFVNLSSHYKSPLRETVKREVRDVREHASRGRPRPPPTRTGFKKMIFCFTQTRDWNSESCEFTDPNQRREPSVDGRVKPNVCDSYY